MASLVVYTAITAGKDKLHEPAHVIPGVEYVCFSDSPISSQIFSLRPLPFRESTPQLTARKLKLFAHLLFPNHGASLWLDGSKRIRRDMTPLLAEMARAPLSLLAHPHRNCAYDEADTCIRLGRWDEPALSAQAAQYRVEGFPAKAGLYETSVLFRRHTNEVAALMEAWWHELTTRTPRDQLSLPYLLWRENIAPQVLDYRNWHDPFFLQYPHAWHEASDNRAKASARLHGVWWTVLARLGLHHPYEKAVNRMKTWAGRA